MFFSPIPGGTEEEDKVTCASSIKPSTCQGERAWIEITNEGASDGERSCKDACLAIGSTGCCWFGTRLHGFGATNEIDEF